MGQISFLIGAGLCKAAADELAQTPRPKPKTKPTPAPKPKPTFAERLRANRVQVEDLSGVPASRSAYRRPAAVGVGAGTTVPSATTAPAVAAKPKVKVEK